MDCTSTAFFFSSLFLPPLLAIGDYCGGEQMSPGRSLTPAERNIAGKEKWQFINAPVTGGCMQQ